MALFNNIKSAAKSVNNKISTGVSNLGKQAGALAASLSSKPAQSSSVVSGPYKSIAPTTKGTVYNNGKPVASTPAQGSYVMKSTGTAYNNGVPVGSTVSPGITNYSSSSSYSPSGTNLMAGAAGALGALRAAGGNTSGGGNYRASGSYASEVDSSPVESSGPYRTPYVQDSYKSSPGVSQVSYSSGQRDSLEAQAGISSAMNQGQQTAANRSSLQGTIDTAQSQRMAQASALQAQIEKLKLEKEISETAALASFDPDKDKYVQDLNDRLRDLEADLSVAQRLSPEEEEAKNKLDELDAQEAAVNAGLNEKITDVNREPVAQGFLSGWGTTFNKDANAKLMTLAANKIPLTQRLATAQQKRQAALDVVKSKIAAARDDRSRASGIYEERYKRKNQLDDEARKSKAQAEKDRYINVGDGQQVYDVVTGKFIAHNPRDYSPKGNGGGSSGGTSPTSSTKATKSEIQSVFNNGLRDGDTVVFNGKGSDGFVDPGAYVYALNKWNGTTKEFLNAFPVKSHVNPASYSLLPAAIRPSSTSSKSSSSTSVREI